MVRHIPLAVVVKLVAQSRHVTAMLMPNISCWLIYERVTCLEYLIKKVDILASARRHPGAKRLIHEADLGMAEDSGAKSRIGGCAKRPRWHAPFKLAEPAPIDNPGLE